MDECGTSAIVPAVANAMLAATGKPQHSEIASVSGTRRCAKVELPAARHGHYRPARRYSLRRKSGENGIQATAPPDRRARILRSGRRYAWDVPRVRSSPD